LLAIPAKLGLPYFALNVVGATCALAGVFLLVRYSPFPLWLKALLPFSYFLGYQYSIVARSYCLLAPVLFATAILARKKSSSYGLYAVAVLLLAHISLHATLMAGAIWIFEVGELIMLWRGGHDVRSRLIWLTVLSLNFVLIILQMWPPADI